MAKLLAGIVATTITIGAAGSARADGKPMVAGKPAKAAASAPPSATDTEATVFRADGFGKSDAESDRVVKKLVDACVESPFSREGMDFESAARCNAQVVRAVQRGKRAIPSILRLLEADASGAQGSGELVGYYARTRLFHVLSKTDSAELEEVLLAGMSKVAKDKNDDRSNDVSFAHEALVKMNGIDPTGLAVAGAVENVHVTTARQVAAWRAFLKDHEGEKKIKVRAGALATAWADAKSKDTKKRYLALSALAAQSPRKAKKLLDEAVEELPESEQEPFFELLSIAWSLDPEVPTLPKPMKKTMKKPTGPVSRAKPTPKKEAVPAAAAIAPPPRAQQVKKSKR